MKCQCWPHIETSLLICYGNQLTGFYMRATLPPNGLRYHATFKVRVAVLQNQYMFAINYNLHWIVGRVNIISKYIRYIFLNFGRGFYGFFSMLFPKAPASWCKKFWTKFCCIVHLYLWAQKMCLRFWKSYFKLKILISLSLVVSFLVDMFNLKTPFLAKTTSTMKSKTHFNREAIEN